MDDWKWLAIIGLVWWLFTHRQSQAQQGFHNEQTLEWTDWRGRERWMRMTRDVRPN